MIEAYDLEGELKATFTLTAEYEGFEEEEYMCPAGYPSVGHGRNLDYFPLEEGEPYPMTLEYSKEWTLKQLTQVRKDIIIKNPWVVLQPPAVRVLLTDMGYNMGVHKLMKFKKMLAALKAKSYLEAAEELKDSLYYTQTGRRAKAHYETLKYLGG